MAHENLDREHAVEGSSNRSFGMVFTVIFLIIGCWPLWYGQGLRWWSIAIAAAFALTAAIRPGSLGKLNRLWLKLGLLLGKMVSPIALGILFYIVLAPIGLIVRITGKDPLRLKLDPKAGSYWIERKPPGPPSDSMSNQF